MKILPERTEKVRGGVVGVDLWAEYARGTSKSFKTTPHIAENLCAGVVRGVRTCHVS